MKYCTSTEILLKYSTNKIADNYQKQTRSFTYKYWILCQVPPSSTNQTDSVKTGNKILHTIDTVYVYIDTFFLQVHVHLRTHVFR